MYIGGFSTCDTSATNGVGSGGNVRKCAELDEPIEIPRNIISIYAFYESDAERKKVERLMNTMLHRRPLLIRGFFGERKTRTAALAARAIAELTLTDKEFAKDYGRLQVIFALPLRKLRDEVFANYFKDVGFVLRAHDEVCDSLKARLKSGKDYLIALAEHAKNDVCAYTQHISNLKTAISNGRVIVTTHSLAVLPALLAYNMKRKPLIVLDEAEDYLEHLASGLREDVVEAIKSIDTSMYNKIRRMLKKEHSKYYVRYSTVKQLLRDAVYISATFPRTIEEYYYLLVDRELSSTWLYTTGPKEKDVMIVYRNALLWSKRDEWKPIVLPQVVELVRVAITKHGVVGVVSRNYELTRDLEEMLAKMGYGVVSDLDSDFKKRLDTAQVIIVTTKGRLYRGVNILRKDLTDIPVVIGFYQGKTPVEHYPYLADYLFEHAGEDIFRIYVKELVYAKNLQALYRFIRKRENRHVIILFDWRFHEAYYHFFKDRLYSDTVRVEVDDLAKVAEVAKQYL